jgi:predicted regulator of Ras-like GTPase activity (Roadblock/LC7/MglB family)
MTTSAQPSTAAIALGPPQRYRDVEEPQEHDAEIVVLPPRNSEPRGVEMDEDIAAYWGLWSEQIGRALLPVLQKLSDGLPDFSSAMICTADGFNLCTIGVSETQVNRLSAMTSSLHSIADAVSGSVHDQDGGALDMVSLSNGASKTVVIAIRNLIIGQLLLWVTAGDDSLGVLLMRAKVAAEEIRAVLGDD